LQESLEAMIEIEKKISQALHLIRK